MTQPPDIGAIFDWDGVIADSSAAHEKAWEWLGAELGKPMPPGHFKKGFGMKNERVIPDVLGWSAPPETVHEWSLRKEALYREVIGRDGLVEIPGAKALLAALHAEGIPAAVGSSGHRANVDLGARILGISGLFRAIVTGEDVSHGKPDPEIFLKAASLIGRAPARCVVFEDARVGLEAARRGGMRSIALATTHPADELQGLADRTEPDLTSVTVAMIQALTEDAPRP